jgi:hypothetical protein
MQAANFQAVEPTVIRDALCPIVYSPIFESVVFNMEYLLAIALKERCCDLIALNTTINEAMQPTNTNAVTALVLRDSNMSPAAMRKCMQLLRYFLLIVGLFASSSRCMQ